MMTLNYQIRLVGLIVPLQTAIFVWLINVTNQFALLTSGLVIAVSCRCLISKIQLQMSTT